MNKMLKLKNTGAMHNSKEPSPFDEEALNYIWDVKELVKMFASHDVGVAELVWTLG
jgi:hypothetical protein